MRVFTLIVSAIRLGVAMLRQFKQACEGPMTDQEVEDFLVAAAGDVPDAKDWRSSIVDLLKILRQDSSFLERRDLWREMGHEDKYDGSAEQNIQLHKDVMHAVAERKIVP